MAKRKPKPRYVRKRNASRPKRKGFSTSAKRPSRRRPTKPLWDWSKGLTYSSLNLWLKCPEQFSLAYIDGWTTKKLSVPLEFGTIWHLCQEHQFASPHPGKVVRDVTAFYEKLRLPTLMGEDRAELERLLCIVEHLFPFYCERYAKEDASYKWLARERTFRTKHYFVLPGNKAPSSYQRTEGGVLVPVWLNGKRDGEFTHGRGSAIGLFETKTKSQINIAEITDLLRADLQTLIYTYSLQQDYGRCPTKILYNVIRRPGERLGKHETLKGYGQRILARAKKEPEIFFRRFDVTVIPSDIQRFITRILDPSLRNAYRWWRSIRKHPFGEAGGGDKSLSRWNSPYHYQNLDALQNKYGRAFLYDLVVTGRTNSFYRRSSTFPELDTTSGSPFPVHA